MTNISYFLLTCLFSHKINRSWQIKVTHILKTELPIRFIFVWIKSLVASCIFSASMISNPNIVTFPCEEKCWWLSTINNPVLTWSHQTMLHKYDWSIWFCIWMSYTENTQFVVIISCNCMAFMIQTLFISELKNWFKKVWVLIWIILFIDPITYTFLKVLHGCARWETSTTITNLISIIII